MIELEHSPIINKFKGYLGNPNIKKAGISIEWTEENLIEYSKCKKDPIYFAEKYMKIVDADGELINFKLYDYQREIITALHTNRRLILLQCRQSGKALPLDTYIPTPNGWKFISELNIGDKVFDENGNETVVSFTSEIFTDHTCYKITFDDRSSIIADANHIWTVYKSSSSLKSSYNKTTEELFNSNFLYEDSRKKKCSRWKIPLSKPVKYPYQNIHIDPYTLGLWLGGGASYGISPELRKLNLLNNKHVPNSYLFNTIEVRLELLRGLMDSDGYVDTNGSNGICFSTKYPLLLDTVYELLTSLGFKVFRKKKTNVNAETLHFHCSR